MKLSLLAGVFAGAVVLTSTASAQLRVDVGLIDTVATVTDARGRFVPNLKADDFIVEEDGLRQIVSHVAESSDEPMSVGIVLDASQSMQGRISTAVAAIERFIRTVHKDDDIFLMTFAGKTSILQDFTDDRSKLSAALRRVQLSPDTVLYDAIDNALLHIERGKHTKRALLLVTDGQDSGDSSDTYREVLANLRHADVMVYALGIQGASGPTPVSGQRGNPPGQVAQIPQRGGQTPQRGTQPQRGGQQPQRGGQPQQRGGQQQDPGGVTIPIPIPGLPNGGITIRRFAQVGRGAPGRGGATPNRGAQPGRGAPTPAPVARGAQNEGVNMTALKAFAEASGGQAWLLDDNGREMNRIMDDIAEELRNQYTVGYYPTHPIRDGAWHRVEIRTRNPAFTVRARNEYFGKSVSGPGSVSIVSGRLGFPSCEGGGLRH
jgi:VWFA-related protein